LGKASADQVMVRNHNSALVFNELKANGPLSRAMLAARIGVTRATSSSIIGELLDLDLVRETRLQTAVDSATPPAASRSAKFPARTISPKKNGRPGMMLQVNPAGGCAVGVDLNVDSISIALTDFLSNVLWKKTVPSDPRRPMEEILQKAERLVAMALAQGAERKLRRLGIGFGLPGLVDTNRGVLAFAPNLKWKDAALAARWSEIFRLPVFVENEANAAALGEYYSGAARGASSVLYLSAGVGIGGCIIADGKIHGGGGGFAGEVGHMQIDPGGELCGCGRRGCLETVASQPARGRAAWQGMEWGRRSRLQAMTRGNLDRLNFDLLMQAAAAGDRLALEVFEMTGARTGQAVASLLNILNPKMVVLGGAFSQAARFLLPVIRETVMANALPQIARGTVIEASAHGPHSCSIGAASLALDAVYQDPLSIKDR